MRGKALLIVGFGVGYVLGAKAGRDRYVQIKKSASKLWNNANIQRQVSKAEGFARDVAPEVTEFLSDRAKRVFAQLSGKAKSVRSSAAKAPTKASAAAKPRNSSAKASSRPASSSASGATK